MGGVHAGITVTELNRIIGEALHREPRIRMATVTAEVSGFKHHLASGHWYFSLKDAESSISCVMFRQNNIRAELKPRDGDAVTVTGHVEIYSRDGKVQLYVTELRAAGVGTLYERFEALKQKLMLEGLFDPGRKKTLPLVPRKVVVITSASGAALHDILNVSGLRSPAVPIVLIPSGVQGAGAAAEITDALGRVAMVPDADVVILARGGGSPEDLWCFNEEIVARAIDACPLPVVSGVGHETDFTIADYVADVRASTPSNAAEIVFPDREELRERTSFFRVQLIRAATVQIHGCQLRIHETRDRLRRLSPERRLHDLTDRCHQTRQRLERAACGAVGSWETQAGTLRMSLIFGMNQKMTRAENSLSGIRTRLEAVSPMKVLDRGYALVCDTEGHVLPTAVEAAKKEEMLLRFRDGQLVVNRKEQGRDGTGK